MNIKTWQTKDLWFKVSERKKATGLVKLLIKNGWELHTGEIIDDLAHGDVSLKSMWIDGQPTEEIQLQKI